MPAGRKPSLLLVPLHALLLTFLITLLGFAVSLLLGIVGCILYTERSGNQLSLALAYRLIALPAAGVVAVVALIITLSIETRRYRHDKALARIEAAES
ncbi:MAG: hypothetical protein JO249_02045 [Acidobacteria bacterium]|nr:hypothetical protein [Acidobacteriota bacterium]